jgi:hypothetical protein
MSPTTKEEDVSQVQTPEVEIVTGQVLGVEAHRSGTKWQVLVGTGQQNPRRLWTSDQSLVQTMMTLLGQTLSFNCGISNWTNQQNQPVRSLWINGYGQPGQAAAPVPSPPVLQTAQPGASFPTPLSPPPQPATVVQPLVHSSLQTPQRISEDEREMRIHRQTASKVAGILISHVPAEERTLDNVLALSERLVAYYEHGFDGNQTSPDEYAGDPGPQGIPQDEIPY